MPEARDSRPRPTGVGPEIDLVPIASAADLAARYSGHFDVAHLKLPRRNRLRGLLWRLLPALMAAVAGAWLALAIRAWLAAG